MILFYLAIQWTWKKINSYQTLGGNINSLNTIYVTFLASEMVSYSYTTRSLTFIWAEEEQGAKEMLLRLCSPHIFMPAK